METKDIVSRFGMEIADGIRILEEGEFPPSSDLLRTKLHSFLDTVQNHVLFHERPLDVITTCANSLKKLYDVAVAVDRGNANEKCPLAQLLSWDRELYTKVFKTMRIVRMAEYCIRSAPVLASAVALLERLHEFRPIAYNVSRHVLDLMLKEEERIKQHNRILSEKDILDAWRKYFIDEEKEVEKDAGES